MSDYLSGIENIFEKKSGRRSAVALIIAYWTKYELTGDELYLHKAFHRAQASQKEYFIGAELYFCKIFITISRGEYTDSYELINKLSQHKNYFKNANPVYYGIYNFLNALLETRIKNQRAANKFFRILEDAYDGEGGELPLMMGILKFESGELGKAGGLFHESYEKGCRSSFLFVYLYKHFLSFGLFGREAELMGVLIRWCNLHNVKADIILNHYKSQVSALLRREPEMTDLLYSVCSEEWLLTEICRNFIRGADYSENAYKYIREAEARQLEIENLGVHLVHCAYVNKAQDVSRYAMDLFLARYKQTRLNDDLKAYIFHLLLNKKKFDELAAGFYEEMLKFAVHCLESDLHGAFYNSVYKFFLEISYTSGNVLKNIPAEYIAKAEKIIFADLFAYEIKPVNRQVKHVWIIEKEKKDLSYYPLEDGQAVIKASGDFFSYVCFGNNSKNILESRLGVTKMVENADIGLYMYFFKKGMSSINLLISLARHIISDDKRSETGENVLKKLIESDEISNVFKDFVNVALGNYYFHKNDMQTAAGYYKNADENNINEKYIEQALIAFMSIREYDKACRLITKKAKHVSDKALFSALKQLTAFEEYRPLIAKNAYELILKSWYDKALLSTALSHYNAGQEEWQQLSLALANISVFDSELDEIILRNAIWMHKLDAGTQKVFARLYGVLNDAPPDNNQKPGFKNIIEDFACYCIYEILINSYRLEYDTIAIIENIYYNTQDKLYAYGLSNLYLTHGISTLKSDDIIERTVSLMTEDGLIFPVFKTSNKDKRFQAPYIEQNQPPIYKCAPNKDVVIYYRTDAEKEYRQKKMAYFRFGLYYASIPHFYGEKLFYYFSEEMPNGSITTKEASIENNTVFINTDTGRGGRSYERFFSINNALVYEQMFRFDMVEKIITERLRDLRRVKGEIM